MKYWSELKKLGLVQGLFPNKTFKMVTTYKGKSVSEALILESVNPQYDKRLFIELQEKYKFRICCVQKLFFCFCFGIQNNVLNLYFSCTEVGTQCARPKIYLRTWAVTNILCQTKNYLHSVKLVFVVAQKVLKRH